MTWFRAVVVRASPRTEFAVVCLIAFGYFSIASLAGALSNLSATDLSATHHSVMDQNAAIGLATFEATILLILGWFLGIRGWTPAKIGLTVDWALTGTGILLAIAAYFVSAVVTIVVLQNWSGLAAIVGSTHPVAAKMGPAALVALCVVNPIYEEVFVSGYLVTALKEKRGLWFAANTSAGVRLLYHLYQGPLAVASVLPVGLLFAYWYARTGRLWPLVVAHALLDALAVAAYQ